MARKMTLEETFMQMWANPPAPFNPHAIQETKDEKEARYKADEAFCATLPNLPEVELRPMRAKFRREYWEQFKANRGGA